jgi:hypothetical protein
MSVPQCEKKLYPIMSLSYVIFPAFGNGKQCGRLSCKKRQNLEKKDSALKRKTGRMCYGQTEKTQQPYEWLCPLINKQC